MHWREGFHCVKLECTSYVCIRERERERERERASTCISHSQVEDALSDSAVQVKDDQLHCR